MEDNTKGAYSDNKGYEEDTVNTNKQVGGSTQEDSVSGASMEHHRDQPTSHGMSADNQVDIGPGASRDQLQNTTDRMSTEDSMGKDLEPEIFIKPTMSDPMAHEESVDSPTMAGPSEDSIINLSEETARAPGARELVIPVGNLNHSIDYEEGIEHFPEYPPLASGGLPQDEIKLIPRPYQEERELKKKLTEYKLTSKELWKTRRQLPWSMIFQVLKLIVITIQVTELSFSQRGAQVFVARIFWLLRQRARNI